MIAKLRVGWMVAGCTPGVRTITSSALFHCNNGLTGCAEGAPDTGRSSSDEAALDLVACPARPAHTSISAIKVLDIDKDLLGWVAKLTELAVRPAGRSSTLQPGP